MDHPLPDDWLALHTNVRVSVSVGGAYFETTVQTLTAGGRESLLYVMVMSEVPSQLHDGCTIPSLFFDRSPIVFAQILEYLRAVASSVDTSTHFGLQYAKGLHPIQLDALIHDSQFYCLGELEKALQHGRRVHQYSREWRCGPTQPLSPYINDQTSLSTNITVSGVICIVYSDTYDCICVGCTLGCVTVFKRSADSDAGFDLHTRFMAHLDIVNDVAVVKDSLVTSSRDGSVCMWDFKAILAGAAALTLKNTCVSLGIWELVVGAKYPGVSLCGDAMIQPHLDYTGDRRLQDHIATTLLEGGLPTAPVASPPNHFIDPIQLAGYVVGKQWGAMMRWRRQVVSICPTVGRCVPVKPGNVVAVFSCVIDDYTIATGDTAGMVRLWNTSSDKNPSSTRDLLTSNNIGTKRTRAPLPAHLSGLHEVGNTRGGQDDEMSLLTQILTSRGSKQYLAQYAMSKLPQPALLGSNNDDHHHTNSSAYIKVTDYIGGNRLSVGSPSLCAEASQRTLELSQAEVDELTASGVLYVDSDAAPALPSPDQFTTILPTIRVWCVDGSFYTIRNVAVIPNWGSFGQKYVVALQGAVKTMQAIHRAGDTIIAAAQRQAVSLISVRQAAVISTVSDVAFGNPLRQVAMYSTPTRLLLLVGCWNGPGFVWDVTVPSKHHLMCEMACPNPPSDESTPWISDVVIAGSHCLVSYDSGSICQVDLDDVIQRFDNQDAPLPSEIGRRLAACVVATPEDEAMLMATTMKRSVVYTTPSVVCTTTHGDVLRCFVAVGDGSATPSLVTGSFGGTLQIAFPRVV